MNRRHDIKNLPAHAASALAAAFLTFGVGNIALAAVPLVQISNIPLTLVDPAHPQVLLAITNSESMDGNLSGAIMTGSGNSSVDTQLNGSSSPLKFTIPTGFTPPVTGGVAPAQMAYTAPSTTKCNSSGSVLCDNSPSRLNVAKASLLAVIQNYMATTDFGFLTFKTSAPALYNTWLYVMSDPLYSGGWFSFSTTNTSPPNSDEYILNPCYGATVGDAVYNDCIGMQPELAVSLAALLADQYMLVEYSSDDPAINDILYAPAGYQYPVCMTYGTVTPVNPYTSYTLSQYKSGSITESYSSRLPATSNCVETTGPTNAGFVPYQPEVMYMQRGFAYYSTPTANQGYIYTSLGTNGIVTAGDNPLYPIVQAAINQLTPYLKPETNLSSTTEIKAQAVQAPVAGMLKSVVSYSWAASSNGCAPQRYVVMITDGLPTMDLAGNVWPPLGSAAAVGYGVSASFNVDGSLNTTNDQALTDTITELTALNNAGIKTYIIGVGAGVDPNQNAQAAATLTAMAVAGGTSNYFPATNPATVSADMTVILTAIQEANQSSSSAAVDSTGLHTGSAVYQAQFTSADQPWEDWTGNLLAFTINSDGTVSATPNWESQTQLDTQLNYSAGSSQNSNWSTVRLVATWNPASSSGVPFEWANLSGPNTTAGTQQYQLDVNPLGGNDTRGSNRVADLRGQIKNQTRFNAASLAAVFRNTSHLLGDIVNSSPLFVGPPNGFYQDSSYIGFEQTWANRPSVIYVGANDGLLHAFDPTTGNEDFAYVPNGMGTSGAGLFANLTNLTGINYNESHQFFVDGSPSGGDVQFADNSWHTIVTGGLNSGGYSIYALDVTDPKSISSSYTGGTGNETTLASKVLWEFTDTDMGLTYSQPFIAKTNVSNSYSSTPFLVFFGNGYNNPNSGDAYIYAVNAQTGALIKRIDLCTAVAGACDASIPNGLSSPVVVNSSGDLDLPDDTLYAGDLQGNLWKVDISNPNPASWTVHLLFQACTGNPCTPANRQPIIDEPVVSLHPNYPQDRGMVVYFGTGQLLGSGDLASVALQDFYGIWDNPNNGGTVLRTQLEAQTLSIDTIGTVQVRLVTNNPIDWSTQYGWVIDLNISGERAVTYPRLVNDAVVFTTYVPNSNRCIVGGQSWLMAVSFSNGGAFASPELDINSDGSLNANDLDGNQVPAGLSMGSVFAAAPTIMSASLGGGVSDVKLISLSSGVIKSVDEANASSGNANYISWREIPPN